MLLDPKQCMKVYSGYLRLTNQWFITMHACIMCTGYSHDNQGTGREETYSEHNLIMSHHYAAPPAQWFSHLNLTSCPCVWKDKY